MPALQRPHFELTLSVLAIILYCFTNVFYPESYFFASRLQHNAVVCLLKIEPKKLPHIIE